MPPTPTTPSVVGVHKLSCPFRLGLAVIVEEGDDGCGCRLHAGVPGGGQAAVDLMTDHRHAVLSGDLARVVGRAVVHDDDLELHVLLCRERVQAPVDSGCAIE